MIPQIRKDIHRTTYDLQVFLNKFDDKKRAAYLRGWEEARLKNFIDPTMTANAKKKEVNRLKRDLTCPDRARMINA